MLPPIGAAGPFLVMGIPMLGPTHGLPSCCTRGSCEAPDTPAHSLPPIEVEPESNPFRGSSCVRMRSDGLALARPSLAIPAGALIGAVVTVSLALELLRPIALLLAGLVVLLPALLVRDAKLYWLSVFLFTLQLDVKKTLVDGL